MQPKHNQKQKSAWVYRDFLKDKVRTRERYWRSADEDPTVRRLLHIERTRNDDGGDAKDKRRSSKEASKKSKYVSKGMYFIPDGVVWRKYLSLISHLVDAHKCNFILLESAAELMDYRNSAPVIDSGRDSESEHECEILGTSVGAVEGAGAARGTADSQSLSERHHRHHRHHRHQQLGNGIADGEAESASAYAESAATQERSKMQKLVLRSNGCVLPFCDLSIREDDGDEFDFLSYSHMRISERSSRALLRAEGILRDHAISSTTTLVILSTDQSFIRMCRSEDDVTAILVEDFVSFMVKNGLIDSCDEKKISDLKNRCEKLYEEKNQPKSTSNDSVYEASHLSENQIEEGMRNGSLLRGRLEVTKANPKEAYVNASDKKFFIDGMRHHMNRSFHHDIVMIRPLPESEYGRPIGRRRLVHHRDDADGEDGEINDDIPAVPSAQVVAISVQSRRKFVCTLVDQPMGDEAACLVIPMDIRIPKIRLRTREWSRFVGKRILVEVDEWEEGSNYPHGRCVEILGPIANLETEIACLLHENEVNLDPFSAAASACLPFEGSSWKIPEEEIKKRLDLRKSHRIFSVDPPGCQDIDDTMHARVLPNGDVEIGVHIADVTYFVRHDTPLDIEARVRGTTFYLVDRRFDMLPSVLSSDLCSLHGNMDRLSVSAIWVMSKDFKKVKSTWYGRTVIHNCQAMTYSQAHNIIHDMPPDDPKKAQPPPLTAGYSVDKSRIGDLKHDLTILTNLARKLRKDREEIGGAVDLSSGDLGNELKFTLDENNQPVKVTPKQDMEIHHTIAELMILANSSVASKIYERLPNHAVLRVHRSVEENRFEDLKDVLDAGKIKFDGKSNMALANSLKQAEKSKNAGGSVNALFRSLATRAMSEAQYVCTGDSEIGSALSHYGLGLEKYTHFTSPIRRYADVIVHKQLMSVLEAELSSVGSPLIQNKRVRHQPGGLDPVTIPDSNVISIYKGEGISSDDSGVLDESNSTVDSNERGTSEQLEITDEVKEEQAINMAKSPDSGIISLSSYNTAHLIAVCEGLNRHNRLAKLSSMDCQSLFLSLYFKDHMELTQGVVTNLKQNGFWVFIPRFDIRAPVYVSDKDGSVQIDPALIGLGRNAGESSTSGFSDRCRLFSAGRSDLIDDGNGERLVVSVPGRSQEFSIRTLDVVTVEISCGDWDVRARVPSPRVHLVANKSPTSDKASSSQTKITSRLLGSEDEDQLHSVIQKGNSESKEETIHEMLFQIEISPVLENVPFRKQNRANTNANPKKKEQSAHSSSILGRKIFGGFVNPDTRSATQEAALVAASEAAAQRRSQAIASRARNAEYDTTQRVEQNITARAQKLSASKRNARKSKGK